MSEPIDFDALSRIGLGPALRRQLAFGIAQSQARPMRLVQVQREHLLLHDGLATHRARCAPALQHDLAQQGESLAVGDWVLAEPAGDGGWRIGCRLLPSGQIARRTVDGRAGDGHRAAQRQVLVSNVDTALLVMGLDGDFNPRRLERYLALARLAGVAAVLVLSKADTLAADRRAALLDQARAALPPELPALALDLRQPAAALALHPGCCPARPWWCWAAAAPAKVPWPTPWPTAWPLPGPPSRQASRRLAWAAARPTSAPARPVPTTAAAATPPRCAP